ncbi:MAG: sigma-70 family RNA polymerase sigma factor [Ignavibacteriales bacterium]
MFVYSSALNELPEPLKDQEEKQYIKRLRDGDESVRGLLVEKNMRLVLHIAKFFTKFSNEYEDMVSQGFIGLIKAAKTYDPHKEIKFATYASRCIENEILMYLRSIKKNSGVLSIESCISIDDNGAELKIKDIVNYYDEDVEILFLKDMQMTEFYKLLQKAFDTKLSKLEQEIITLRYFGENLRTQKEASEILGKSQSYISRIEKRAIGKIQKYIKSKDFQMA